jgi:hypothetical protein
MSAAKPDPGQAERAARRAAWTAKLQGHLSKFGSPRTDFTLLAALTGGAGFLASAGLLGLGLRFLWLRYALAVLISYLVFLALLGVWLGIEKRRLLRGGVLPEEPPIVRGTSGKQLKAAESGWDAVSSIFDGLSGTHDLGAFFIGVLIIVAVISVLFGVVVVIASAPELLAEVLLDGLLSAGLYHRLRGLDSSHWLESAVRRTWKPFLGVLIIFLAGGLVLHGMDPRAVSLWDFWKHLRQGHR